jgi:hypothetical protein
MESTTIIWNVHYLRKKHSPNNGSSESSVLRRGAWDRDVLLFFSRAAKRGRSLSIVLFTIFQS